MVTRATRDTLSYQRYVGREQEINILYAKGELSDVQMKVELQENIDSLIYKEDQALQGFYCLKCDNTTLTCKCPDHETLA